MFYIRGGGGGGLIINVQNVLFLILALSYYLYIYTSTVRSADCSHNSWDFGQIMPDSCQIIPKFEFSVSVFARVSSISLLISN